MKAQVTIGVLLGLAGITAVAQVPADTGPQLRIGIAVGETDNLNRDEAGLIRSDITRLDLGFGGQLDGTHLRGGVAGDLQYRRYGAPDLEDNDEVLGSVDGRLQMHFVPDRVRWDFDYSFGQVRNDPTAAVGPSNRQRTTIAATGPAASIPMGDRNSLEFSARVADRSFSSTQDLDSRLTTSRLGFVRSLNQVTDVSLNLENSDNEFDSDAQSYEFEIASIEYQRELASGQAFASLGRGRVIIGGESQPTTVTRLAWNRSVGSRSQLEICVGREITDAGNVFAAGGGAVGCQGGLSGLEDVARTTDGRLQGIVLSASPLLRESLGLRMDVEGDRSTFTIAAGTAKDRFEVDSSFDNDLNSFQVSVSRQLGSQWTVAASMYWWDQEFVEAGVSNEDQYAQLSLSRNLARGATVSLSLERNRRVSLQDPFDENAVYLSIGRRFGA